MDYLEFRKKCQYFMDDECWCKRDEHKCIRDKCLLYLPFLKNKIFEYRNALDKIINYPHPIASEMRKIAVNVIEKNKD